MVLRAYNSLTRRKEPFTVTGCVKMFVCGPTVYDYAHLGHARTYIAFDIIVRYLKFFGYDVRYLMNITDVADRILQRAAELKKDPLDLARDYEGYFFEDMKALGIGSVDRYLRASQYVTKMIAQVTGLVNRGIAYETDTGVYFEVRKFPRFGEMSAQTHEELGLKRLELCSKKRNPEDFSLWRKYDSGLVWDSPWGHGRPGWHIEDTAISMTEFGETYDIHGGASELIFPHHEAEIAQAEALSGKTPFVRFWLHTGLLSMKGRKMSKSLGNVIRIRDALKEYTAQEVRYYFASFHYRQPVGISDAGIKKAKRELASIVKNFEAFLGCQPTIKSSASGKKLSALVRKAEVAFTQHMNDDFDTPKALRILLGLSRELAAQSKGNRTVDQSSKDTAEKAFRRMAGVFDILPQS